MTDDLMTRARQALADEQAARLEAKAEEIVTADERDRLTAEKAARREQIKEAAAEALAAEGVTLPDLRQKFDAAVAALVDLAQAADNRAQVVRQHAAALQVMQLPDAEPVSPPELVARAAAIAADKVGTYDNGLNDLSSNLVSSLAGPLWRKTAVECAER